MSSLQNKKILLGVTGGIAAYKSAEIIRRLQDAGAAVRVVMTRAAQEFITPLTLQALSGQAVHTSLLDTEAEAAMGHIELSRWADVILVAPASADFISKLAMGEGSDLLSTLCLASKSMLALAPAMNQGMWSNPATQSNLDLVTQRGAHIFGPAAGIQACGDVGLGRMLEPQAVADACASLFKTGELAGKTVVITAGPTREAIDPVRYISNHSSGKMGYALAAAAIDAGAKTILITGPVNIEPPEHAECIHVISAQNMYDAALEQSENADIFIGAAAVADFRVKHVAQDKLKKRTDEESSTIELIKNPDIIASVASQPKRPFIVGFAAETRDVENYAKEKLARKKLDLIVANDVSQAHIGFNSENNAVIVISKQKSEPLSERSKAQLARDLMAMIASSHDEQMN